MASKSFFHARPRGSVLATCHQTPSPYVYVANERGELTVLRAGDALEFAAKAALGEHIRSTPAIAGRSIFVRTSGHMWAFGE